VDNANGQNVYKVEFRIATQVQIVRSTYIERKILQTPERCPTGTTVCNITQNSVATAWAIMPLARYSPGCLRSTGAGYSSAECLPGVREEVMQVNTTCAYILKQVNICEEEDHEQTYRQIHPRW
jgi:hypothetical protein